MNFEDLTPEQREKAKSCETPEDIIALAREAGYELSDDELKAVAGGLEVWCKHGGECLMVIAPNPARDCEEAYYEGYTGRGW